MFLLAGVAGCQSPPLAKDLSLHSPAPFDRLKQAERTKANHYWQLAHDNDWLTGIWLDDTDAAMSLYTLIEKCGDSYQATNYYPRDTITWWTGKIDKYSNQVDIWNYEIVNDRFVLPKSPSGSLFFEKPDRLCARDNREYGKHLVKDPAELAELAGHPFTTGQPYLSKEIAQAKQHRAVTEHYDALVEQSSLLKGLGDISDLAIIKQETLDQDHYILFQISGGFPPRGGENGAVEDNGYYWVHLTKKGSWKIAEEWLLVRNSSTMEILCRENDQGGFLFTAASMVRQSEKKSENAEMANLRTKPNILTTP
jgi:hypothetical protein